MVIKPSDKRLQIETPIDFLSVWYRGFMEAVDIRLRGRDRDTTVMPLVASNQEKYFFVLMKKLTEICSE
jgi:hypothetical protein